MTGQGDDSPELLPPVAARGGTVDLLQHIGHEMGGADIVPLEYGPGSPTIGFRVRETDTHYIDVIEQLFNWRVCSTYKPNDGFTYDAGYCYIGKGVDTFVRAVLGAAVWDGPGHGDPPGWDKNAFTGVWNPDSRHRK